MLKKYFNSVDIKLNIEKVAVSECINLDYIKYNTELNDLLDHELDRLVLRLHTYIACSEEKSFTQMFPLNVWEHIKVVYAPSWLLKKYPVKYEEITFKAKECFPELTGITKGMRHLHIRKYT